MLIVTRGTPDCCDLAMAVTEASGRNEFTRRLEASAKRMVRPKDLTTTDGSWTGRTTKATLLYSVEVPRAGGETHFADMYRAYELLPEVM